MKIAIHQPHYFPWIGYYDKMAKVDAFVLLDEVQFEKGSQMIRNRIIDTNGEVKYLTISGDTSNFLDKEYKELKTINNNAWTEKQMNMIRNYYRKAKGLNELLPIIQQFFSSNYQTICSWTCESILLAKKLLAIDTPIIFQSNIDYDRNKRKSDLVNAICNALGADVYFSGKGGSVDYLDRNSFEESGIDIEFQEFSHPQYKQVNSKEFQRGLSILDLLFNCGIEEAKSIFWGNIMSEKDNVK